jgi:phosphoribosylamine--glycine ligase
MGVPIVVKTDGLAAGKGAVICQTLEEADEILKEMLVSQTFGEAGARVIIEEFLDGEEVSVFILSDGEHFKILPCSQDHKAVYDGDTGPNTGGMGAYAPAAMLTPDLMETIIDTVAKPSIEGMALEGHPYRGLLYAGLMLTSTGPKLLEYNCRFGDPETQAVLPLIKSDLLELLMASADGTLDTATLEVHDKAAVCVVMASGGYPGTYEKGHPILGLDWPFEPDTIIFHAGTRREKNDTLTAGGRVLGITAMADSIPEAIKKAYAAVGKITFNQAYYRKDIAQKALRNLV